MQQVNAKGLYVMASRRGKLPNPWAWEIRRKIRPLGVKLWGGYFRSEQAAIKAGQDALRELLSQWQDPADAS
jgi:hypothetical protein